MDLPVKVKKTILREGLIDKGDRILLAISGGIDSVALLYILDEIRADLGFELALGHVNHGLRGEESERDEKFVEALSRKFNIPFHLEKVNVNEYIRDRGLSLQHAARDLRYKALFSMAERHNYSKIAVAHTLDDQVETFFLRVIKGTGINGISSIPVKRGPIIRPVLFATREEIERYCAQKGIGYVEDSTNKKILYERNYLRNVVIPLFYRINPRFKEKVANLLADITNVNEMFNKKANEFISHCMLTVEGEYSFETLSLKGLDRETRFRVLSKVVDRLSQNFIIQRNHVKLIEKILYSEKPCLEVRLPGGIFARKSYKRIIFGRSKVMPDTARIYELNEGINDLSGLGIRIELRKFKREPGFDPRTKEKMVAYLDGGKAVNLKVRTFRKGDRFVPLGLKHQVKLKDFFIKNKIPRDQRRRIPLVLSDGDIAWVVGLRIDERYKVTDETEIIIALEVSYQNNEDRVF